MIVKCLNCGKEIKMTAGDAECTCSACGNTQEGPSAEKLDILYNAALECIESDDPADVEDGVRAMRAIIEWRDARAQVSRGRKRIEELNREDEDLGRKVAEAKKNRNKKMRYGAIALAVLAAGFLLYPTLVIKPQNYKVAQELFAAGDYANAAQAYTSVGNYKDAADMVKESKYLNAAKLMEAGDTEGAKAVYEEIRGYRDVDAILAGGAEQ